MRPSEAISLRRLSWICIALLVAWFATEAARAFFPTNVLAVGGLLGRSHVRITSDAIEEIDAEFFALPKLTKSMKKAIEQIADANAEVDQDQVTSAKHFDGESFPEGQARLATLLTSIQNALAADDATGARSALGGALHTIQDFYSHSNWVELGNSAPNSALGRPASHRPAAGHDGDLPGLHRRAAAGALPELQREPHHRRADERLLLRRGPPEAERRQVQPRRRVRRLRDGAVRTGDQQGLVRLHVLAAQLPPHRGGRRRQGCDQAVHPRHQGARDRAAVEAPARRRADAGDFDRHHRQHGRDHREREGPGDPDRQRAPRHRRGAVEVRPRAVQRSRRGPDDRHRRSGRVQERDQRPVRLGRRRLPRALDERHAAGAQRVRRGRRPLHVHRRELGGRLPRGKRRQPRGLERTSRSTPLRSAAARRSIPATG